MRSESSGEAKLMVFGTLVCSFASRRIDDWLDNVILPKRVVLTLDPPPLPVEDFSPNFSSISLVSIVNQPEVVLNTDVAPLSEPEECPLAQWEFEVLGYAIKLPDIDTLMCRKCIAAEVALAATWAVLVVLFLFSVILSCIRSFTRCKACKCQLASFDRRVYCTPNVGMRQNVG